MNDRDGRNAGEDRVETASTLDALEFVREGTGVALLNPFPIALRLPEEVVLRPFRPELEFTTSFLTAMETSLSARVRGFIKHVKFFSPRDPWSRAV